ncbi:MULTISPECIES: aminotransferase class I/II-fold pyridoxal phosphate-dependent enzyme [unclassified Serratia (in: enterobacteria)]|uniref:aminotransferase class I/II-fold pyridoxal phosphate-dependent enzyme n=1 Tax=unclassified Serratia (in: enterobacteria) TaxID=2647522 RepID=UPI00307686CE
MEEVAIISSEEIKSVKINGEELLSSYISFCHKYKKKYIPKDLNLDMKLSDDLALDSINQVEYMLYIESLFGITIDPDKSTNARSFRDLLALINEISSSDGKKNLGIGITDLQRHLIQEIPQFYNEVSAQSGRKLQIKDKIVYDFASANYLGLDLDERIFTQISEDLKKWGTHPSWSRAIASPSLYTKLEKTLCEIVNVPEVLVFPTVTLIHMGILPLLATPDTLFIMDERAHKSIQEGVDLAYAKGASKKFFEHNNIENLRVKLEESKRFKSVYICVDGVYSMTGIDAKLREIIALIKNYANTTLYIDDAHGFGLWGSSPSEENPYGTGGGGLLRKYEVDVCADKVIYVAGLSKAFSSLGAFITCRNKDELEFFSTAPTFINSGPCPTASLSSAQTGLEISQSEEGDLLRKHIYKLTERFINGVREVGLVVHSEDYYPLISVEIGTIAAVTEAAKILWTEGILITPAVYPNAPIKRSMLRFTITAANTFDEIDSAINALEMVRDLVPSAPYN